MIFVFRIGDETTATFVRPFKIVSHLLYAVALNVH